MGGRELSCYLSAYAQSGIIASQATTTKVTSTCSYLTTLGSVRKHGRLCVGLLLGSLGIAVRFRVL
jgi:hypothetical protein